MKKVGHTSEFHFGIYWWTLKNLKKIRILKIFYKNCWRYHHFTHVYQKPQLYEVYTVSEIRSETIFFVILGKFLPFTSPPNNPENQNYEKMNKTIWRCHYFRLVQQKTRSSDYAYPDMECDKHNFLSFKAIFCSFTPLLTAKIKIWKKCNKDLEKLSFYTCTP